MRILFSVDPEIPVPPRLYGGIERIVNTLIRALRERRHQIGLLANSESSCVVEEFFPWPGGSSGSWRDSARNTWALYRAVRHFEPDIVHSFSRLMYLLPLVTSGYPRIMSFQRQPSKRTVRWSARLAGGALKFTGCSEFICREGRRGGGSWTAIPNFADLSQFTFRERVAEEAPLVFLSRIERIKGAHTAIAAAQRAGRRLIIAGNRAESGKDAEYWQREIAPHVDGDRVSYVGPLDDKQKNELLGRAAALLVPIEWEEPFGIVFAEALACGTPVISCPRGALPEIVREGIDGFLARDLDGLVQAIARVANIDRSQCRQRAEHHFSSARVVEKYEDLYKQLVTPQGLRTPAPLGAETHVANVGDEA